MQDDWQPARLIPTSGINGFDEAEHRATSALLAVIGSVREFGNSIVRSIGAPAGRIETYIEVPLDLSDGRTCRPDGALVVTRGQSTWTALVEVKTGPNDLDSDQVDAYLEAARLHGFDAVLTISNQMCPAAGIHPVNVDRRKTRKVELHHLSWTEIVTTAVQIRVHHGVSDPDQAWILGELIRYLEHPRSGACDFSDMGSSWVQVRDAVSAGTLRPSDAGVDAIASRWDQLLRFAALRLGRELGADVQVSMTRREANDPPARLARFVAELADTGILSGAIRIPGTIAPIEVFADLRASTVTTCVSLDAPQEGRPTTRVNWLVRQLRDAPDQTRIDGIFAGTRSTTSELLGTVRADPTTLCDPSGRDFRAFRVAASSPLGTKRNTGRGAFIDSVLASIDGFYESIVQVLRPWTAKAPQLPASGKSAAEESGIDTTTTSDDVVDVTPFIDPDAQDEPDLPDELVADIREDVETIEWAAATPPPYVPPGDLVTWEAAEDRIERERLVSGARTTQSDA